MAASKTRDLVYMAMFVVIMTVCSWITIPYAIPFTLGTFGVFFACLMLGGKRATISVAVYVLLGAVGAPVFSGFKGGPGAILGNTGGYIIGFIVQAMIIWAFEKVAEDKIWIKVISMVLGLIACYAFGTAWFMVAYAKSVGATSLGVVLGWCVTPYIIPDLIKLALAFVLHKSISSQLGRKVL